jgi:hypothetical protein
METSLCVWMVFIFYTTIGTQHLYALFFSPPGKLATGILLTYIVGIECNRHRIWEYWRLQWQQLTTHFSLLTSSSSSSTESSKTSTSLMDLNGITLEHVVSPRSHRTSDLNVDVIHILPQRQLIGTSMGVEIYILLQGTLRIDGTEIDKSNNRRVVEPFLTRRIENPSHSTTAVVYRITDGIPKDTTVDDAMNQQYNQLQRRIRGLVWSASQMCNLSLLSRLSGQSKEKKHD